MPAAARAYTVTMGLLAALVRFNAAHPWSHNDAFTGAVLRHARAVRRGGGATAVDVGCGTGNLVDRLASAMPRVIGIEPDGATAAIAAERFAGSQIVQIDQRPFGDEQPASYDLIVFVASLHHMALRPALRSARKALRPAGRIVIVGLAQETSEDSLRTIVSLVLNPIIGFIRHPKRATRPLIEMRAPTAPVSDTFDEIRAVAHELLPGIRMRRRLFWRYTAVWTAPD